MTPLLLCLALSALAVPAQAQARSLALASAWLQREEGARSRALQPGGAFTVKAGQCGPAPACTFTGSAAYTTRNLTYSPTTGIFTGSLTTNQCPHLALESTFAGVQLTGSVGLPTLQCGVFSSPFVRAVPAASPLRGAIGYSIRGGLNVYGPMDAGFSYSPGRPGPPGICSAPAAQYGFCPGGTDVDMCLASLQYHCGSANAAPSGFASACGNHASPSHYHTLLSCDYNASDPLPHSPLLAVLLDGRGLYGKWEGGGSRPADLDACGGHTGLVPATTLALSQQEHGDTFYPASAAPVYHYHVQDEAPFLGGCFGPVPSMAAAKALYPTCTRSAATAATNVTCPACTPSSVRPGSIYEDCTSRGATSYQLDCPVFSHHYANGSVELNNQVLPTAACPGCSNCTFPPAAAAGSALSATASASASATPTPSPTHTGAGAGAGSSSSSSSTPSAAAASATGTGTGTGTPTASLSLGLSPSATATPTATPSTSATAAASGAPPTPSSTLTASALAASAASSGSSTAPQPTGSGASASTTPATGARTATPTPSTGTLGLGTGANANITTTTTSAAAAAASPTLAALGGVGGAIGLALAALLLLLLGVWAGSRGCLGGKGRGGKLLSAGRTAGGGAAAATSHPAGHHHHLSAPPAGSVTVNPVAAADALPPGWEAHTDGTDHWYTNPAGESVWERPSCAQQAGGGGHHSTPV